MGLKQMPNTPTVTERANDRERWWSIHDKETYICPDCGRTQDEHNEQWHVHHLNGVPGKIVALCNGCHLVRHGADPKTVNLEVWQEEFLALGE